MDESASIKNWDCAVEVINLASELIQIPSENPPGNVKEIAALIRDYLRRAGLSVAMSESISGKTSVVAELHFGDGPTLILNGHMDVVPAGDLKKWSWDPFGGELQDGYLLGRGASDMKAGLAGLLVSLKRLTLSDNLHGHVILMAVPDEETGGELGTRWLLEEGITGDACLIAEPSGINPTIGQKGNLWINAVTHGVSAHGSLSPAVGKNAILLMRHVIDTLYSLWDSEWPIPATARQLIARSQEILKDEGHAAPARVLDRVTVNVGTISGGEKVNMIPGQCEAAFDLRIPIGISTNVVLRQLEQQIAEQFSEEVDIMVKANPNDANFTLPDDPFVELVLHAIAETARRKTQPVLQWASSDARYFRYRGIPTVQFGPAELAGIHSYDERVKVKDVVEATHIYTSLMHDFLGEVSAHGRAKT